MSTPKYIIELSEIEQTQLLSVLVDQMRNLGEEMCNTAAICGSYTNLFKELNTRYSELQHLFTLLLCANKSR